MHIIFLILDTYVCSQILSAYIIIYFKFLTDRAPSAIEEPADSVDTTNGQTSSKVREYSRRDVQESNSAQPAQRTATCTVTGLPSTANRWFYFSGIIFELRYVQLAVMNSYQIGLLSGFDVAP